MDCVHFPSKVIVKENTPQISLCHKHIKCYSISAMANIGGGFWLLLYGKFFHHKPLLWHYKTAYMAGFWLYATIDNTEHIKHCYQI
jgi:hypothetical protein